MSSSDERKTRESAGRESTENMDSPVAGASGRAANEAVQAGQGTGADTSPPRGAPFSVVGIGASAGGLDAFTHLLEALPDDIGMAFVLVQHLDPHHPSQLPEILATTTAMPVRTVEDGMAVRPNEVFVIPPNATMVLEDGVLRLSPRNSGLHLPIDVFFESLARAQGPRAIAIVLSGTASDGSLGVRAVKQECGLTFAQDESTAQHLSMPRSAVATGAIDYVMTPADIARELVHLSHHPFIHPPLQSAQQEVLPESNNDLKRVFSVLREATRVDFNHYKRNTVRRRIGRRMLVKHVNSLNDYARLVEEQPNEIRELYRDLLISVTSFFRDPEVFHELRRLLRDILANRNPDEAFRVWVPGCATGEELYSLAICVRELLDDLQLRTPVQLFGTDISDLALERARAGVYSELIAQDLSPEQLRRFFVRVDRGYQVSKSLRENCVFARQDVTSDPPFGRTDLVSCRNLLIYLDSVLQSKVLPVFHYSLNPTGLLLLGSAESITAASDLFTVVDKQRRIYARKAMPLRLTLQLGSGGAARNTPNAVKVRTAFNGIELQKKVDLVVQSKYAPAAVVVDSNLQILQFRGHTGFYLEPPPGEANLHLLRMARADLEAPLRKAIDAAARQDISIREIGISVEHRGERREINIEVTPIPAVAPEERYFLVVFEEGSTKAGFPSKEAPALSKAEPGARVQALESQVRDLQQQLAQTREHLRNANEDHEANSEELRAANEEIRSANEELQSTNEELSTTKEELQSANEELNTLNEELQHRNHDLDALNNDLSNLLGAVELPFLMVDNQLRLRRFSAAAEKALNVKPADIGYSIKHIEGSIDLSSFEKRIGNVIEALSVEQCDVQDARGHWFSTTIRPYRTADNRIAGAVIVFVDIDPLKRMLKAAEEARDYAEGMIETVREPLLVLDGDLRVQRATTSFYETFLVTRGETEGRLLYDLGNGQWNVPKLRELVGEALFRNASFQDFEVEHDFPHIGRRTMRLNARRISRDGEDHRIVLLAIEDVTERRELAEIRYQRLFETAKDGMLVFDTETERLIDVNPFFLELSGYGRECFIGLRFSEMKPFAEAAQIYGTVAEARSGRIVRYENVCMRNANGRQLEVELVANRYLIGSQEVVQVNIRDVTKRNEAVRFLRESEERFRLFVDSVRDYALFQMDLTGHITSWNSGAERLLGFNESEIIGQCAERVFTPEDVARGEAARELETARLSGRAEDERWHQRKDGSRFFASGVLTTVLDEAGRLRGFAKIMRDMTARKSVEEQLKQQAQLLELAQDMIIVRALDGTISFWNDAASAAFGWNKVEAIGKVTHELLRSDFPEPLVDIDRTLLAEGRWEGELVHRRRDGSEVLVWSRWALQLNSEGKPACVLEIDSDITARKHADRQLRHSLREKEVLLKEIHHRVKNNLQVIASLLSLQSEYLADSKAFAMIEDMKNRVRSIAAIHEMLYASTDLSRIDFSSYLNAITKDLTSFYSVTANRVRVVIDSQPLFLKITQAVPCGLLINELLTNSFKYAFPDKRSGMIKVSFRCDDDQCALEVSDDGVGLPENLNPQQATSMGLQLVSLLVQQLKARMEIDRSSGTRFVVHFTPRPA